MPPGPESNQPTESSSAPERTEQTDKVGSGDKGGAREDAASQVGSLNSQMREEKRAWEDANRPPSDLTRGRKYPSTKALLDQLGENSSQKDGTHPGKDLAAEAGRKTGLDAGEAKDSKAERAENKTDAKGKAAADGVAANPERERQRNQVGKHLKELANYVSPDVQKSVREFANGLTDFIKSFPPSSAVSLDRDPQTGDSRVTVSSDHGGKLPLPDGKGNLDIAESLSFNIGFDKDGPKLSKIEGLNASIDGPVGIALKVPITEARPDMDDGRFGIRVKGETPLGAGDQFIPLSLPGRTDSPALPTADFRSDLPSNIAHDIAYRRDPDEEVSNQELIDRLIRTPEDELPPQGQIVDDPRVGLENLTDKQEAALRQSELERTGQWIPRIESGERTAASGLPDSAKRTAQPADSANLRPQDAQIDAAKSSDRTGDPADSAVGKGQDKLDEKTGATLKYDGEGRLTDAVAKDGKTTHFEYSGDSQQPSSVRMNDAQGKPVLQLDGDLKVDRQTGVISQTRDLQDGQSAGGRIETTFSPDQTASVTRFDAAGHRLSQENSQPTVDGIKLTDKTNFVYTDANGNPTQEAGKIDDSKPVMSVRVDESGRVADRYAYATPEQLEQSKPNFHEQVKYSEDPKSHTKTEQHATYDLTDGKRAVYSAEKVTNLETGVTTLDTRQANGVEQHIQFDRNGKPTTFQRTEQDESGQRHFYDFELKEGAVSKVSKDNQEVSGPQVEQIKQIGNLSIEQARQQNNVEAQIASPKEALGPTEPREGDKPSGTLVWKEGETLRQASVEGGQVKDGNGKAIGTVQDNGSVSLSGPPPSSFKIGESEGAAFHGVGSDQARLDLVSQKDVQGFSGTLTSPDGSQRYAVVGGNLYDSSGKMYAHLNQHGKLSFPNDNPPPTDVNSQLAGWKFRGTENGQQRLMDCAPKAPSGKLFIPDEQGKPVEYEVRMGMIVNKATQEQYGLLKAPTETADGKLIGGAITLAKNGETRELADFKHAVFDLHLNGEGGRPSRNIQGASLGHIERMADGTPKPGQGGLFNVQDALDAQKHKVDHADAKVKEQERFFNRMTGFLNKNDQVAHEREIAHIQSDQNVKQLQKMIATGQASDQSLQFLQGVTKEAKQAGLEDPLIAQRRKLDTDGKHLEDLPKDPKQINGTVRFPDDRYATGDTLHVIKNGKIMGADGKTPIGTIDSASGDMTLLNPKTGQPVKTSMRDLEGSVWNLQYIDDKGSAQQSTWVSLGDRGGIASVADLKQKAAGELDYAKAVNEKAGSAESQKYQDEVAKRTEELNQRLDKISRDGVSMKDGDRSDLNMLANGAGKFVRPEDHKEGASEAGQKQAPRQRIEVPELNGQNVNQVNGDLRVGNHVYKINNGELREVHFKDGQTTVDTEPCGKLGPNYTVSLPGQQIDLARESRVLMQFTVGNEKEPHQIIGLGPGRYSADHGFQSGGLVEGKELYRRSMEIRQEALSGNNDYFANKPWITGTALDMAGSFDEHENQLATYGDRLDQTVKEVTAQTDKLFKDGFNPETFYNNKLDTNIDLTQRLMDYIGATATTSKETASEARATQKMIADSAVMAATTVVTAGAGSFFAAASTAGKMTVGAAYAAELGTGVLAGSAISVAGRATDSSKWQDNAASGAIEGGAMAFGSVFGKAVGAINDLNQLKSLADLKNAGAALGAEQLAMLETGVGKMMLQGYSQAQIKAAYYGSRVLDATVQTATMTTASAIQEKGLSYVLDHKMETLQKADIASGTLWMLAGQVAGHGAEQLLGRTGKAGHNVLTTALGETEEAKQLAQKIFGVSEQGIATRVLNDTVNSYANSGLGAMHGALQAERERIGRDLGIPPELVTGKLLGEHVNQANVLSAMHEAGVAGTLTAPLLTLATHPIQGKAESLVGIHRDEHGNVIRPAEHTPPEAPSLGGNRESSVSAGREAASPEKIGTGSPEDHLSRTNEKTADTGDGSRVVRPGDAGPRPNEQVMDLGDGGRLTVRDDQIVSVQDKSGKRAELEYDPSKYADGEPSKVKLENGIVIERQSNDEYKIVYPEGHPRHGQESEPIKGKIGVSDDGQIRVERPLDIVPPSGERPTDSLDRSQLGKISAAPHEAVGDVLKMIAATNPELAQKIQQESITTGSDGLGKGSEGSMKIILAERGVKDSTVTVDELRNSLEQRPLDYRNAVHELVGHRAFDSWMQADPARKEIYDAVKRDHRAQGRELVAIFGPSDSPLTQEGFKKYYRTAEELAAETVATQALTQKLEQRAAEMLKQGQSIPKEMSDELGRVTAYRDNLRQAVGDAAPSKANNTPEMAEAYKEYFKCLDQFVDKTFAQPPAEAPHTAHPALLEGEAPSRPRTVEPPEDLANVTDWKKLQKLLDKDSNKAADRQDKTDVSEAPVRTEQTDRVTPPADTAQPAWHMKDGEPVKVSIPNEHDFQNKSSHELNELFAANQHELAKLVDKLGDKIPFLGFHGCSEPKYKHLSENVKQPDGQDFLVFIMQHKGGTAEERLANLASALDSARTYTKSNRVEQGDVKLGDVERGPIVVVEVDPRKLARLPGVSSRGDYSQDNLWPRSTCVGELGIHVEPGSDRRKILGTIEPQRYQHLELSGRETPQHFDPEHNEYLQKKDVGHALMKQMLVLDALQHADLLSAPQRPGAAAVERPGAGELKRGSEVEFNGEKHTIAGFDTKSGDVVLRQQHHDDDLQVRAAPPNVESDPGFGKVKVGEHTFYHDRSDPDGKVYSVLKSPTGTDVLLLEPGYKVVKREQVSVPTDHGPPPDKPTEVLVNGKKVQLSDGEVTVGRSHQKGILIDGLHPNVSRDHLVVRQDSEGRTFIKDISRDGTFRQKEDGSWERLEKGKEVLLKPTDMVRMGSPNGPELNLKERSPEIYLNGQKVEATGNEVIIGREHQKDLLKGLLNSTVSREHLVLRQDAQGQLFVKDTSKEGTYWQALDGSWERLPKGQEVAVSPTDVLRLGGKDGAELRLSERPPVVEKVPLPVVPPAAEQPMKAGCKVEFEGNKYFVSGFDKNTGDIILCRPGHGADFVARPRELTPEFTPVKVGNETYYRNPEGAMFKLKGLEGQQSLVQDHEMRIVSRDRITEIARLKAEAPVAGDVRPLTPEQLRRRNDGEYLTMFFRRETAAEPEAVRQSNEMARKHQISEKLLDGFQLCTAEGVGIGGDGRTRQKHSPDIVLDRTQDKILNRYIAEAHRQFDHLKNDPQALAAELTKFAKKVMHPDGWTERKLDDAYGEFNKEFAGKRMLLGEVINRSQKGEYGGVCAQQAMLLKVLGDTFGLETRLVYGHYKETKVLPSNPSCNHAWTEMNIDGKWLIFDPRQRRHGEPVDGHPSHFHLADRSQVTNAQDLLPIKDKQAKPKSGEQAEPERAVPAESRAPEHSRPGSGGKPEIPADLGLRIDLNDKVRFLDKDGWKVTGFNETTGNLELTRDNTRRMSGQDFVALNPNQRYRPGQEYTATDLITGKTEPGWTLVGKDKDGNALLVKKDGLKVEASPKEIANENPGLVQPIPVVLDSLDRSQSKLQDGQLSLDKVLLGTVGSRNPISEGKVTNADGSTTDVIVHRFGGEGDSAQRSAERMRKELAAYKLNQLLGFDNGFPPTAPIGKDQVVTHKGQPQDGVEGWIQKKNGDQFEREMQNLAHQELGRHGHQAVSELVKNDPQLRKQIEQAFVERLIYGDRDSLSTNFVVVNENGQTRVRNIDLQEAFGQHRIPDWQALPKHGINERLHRDFSDKPLSSDVREQIQKFVDTWNTEAGRKELADSLNLSSDEVGAMLARAEWLADKGRFPRAETQKQLLEKAAAQKKLEENKTLYGRFKNAVKRWLGRDD